MQGKYTYVHKNARHWALFDGRPLGAVSVSTVRPFVFPLLTPSGAVVLAECPPDHPHHQGIMVGQDLVNGHNFWAMGGAEYPLNRQAQEKWEEAADEAGITFTQKLNWLTREGQHVLKETRTTRFEAWEEFTFVGVSSEWIADFGEVFIGQTKEGGLGMRVHPQLETFWGGQIRSSAGKTGEKEIFDSTCDWVEVAGQAERRPVGIVMMPHPSQTRLPTFTRDYGIHLYGPYRHGPGHIKAGESVSLRAGFAAFDGISDGSQASRAWREYSERK